MKANKKLVNVLIAMSVAIPMTFNFIGDKAFAATVNFSKVDQDSNAAVSGAKVDFYDNSGTKIFTITTDSNGKPSKNVAVLNKDYGNVVDENGNLSLRDGDYTYREVSAPEGYMINTKLNKLSISNDVSDDIVLQNKKFKEKGGQLVINAVDNKVLGVSGATLDLFKKNSNNVYELVGTFSTDDDGNVLSTFDAASNNDANLEVVNGSISLSAGNYKIEEKNVPSKYTKISNPSFVSILSGKTNTVKLVHNHVNSNAENTQNNSEEIKTGLRLRYVYANNVNKGIADVSVAVYSVNSKGEKDTKIFAGKTGKDGYLDLTSVSTGSEYLKSSKNGNVLKLTPGKYIFKLDNVQNSKEHLVTVTDGKINSQVIKATGVSANSKNNSSNVKTKGSTLAKTGEEYKLLFASLGTLFVAGGIFLLKNR